MSSLADWDIGGVQIQRCDERGGNFPFRVNISLSLAALAVGIVFVVGLSSWGCMYALNQEGYNFFSQETQQDTFVAFGRELRAAFSVLIDPVQMWEEDLRIALQDDTVSWGQLENSTVMLSMIWSAVKQARTSYFYGLPNGDGAGFVISDSGNVSHFVGSNGLLVASDVDYFGRAGTPRGALPWNATTEPWYSGVAIPYFNVTEPYVSLSGEAVIVGSLPLFADLQPPAFSPSNPVLVAPNGPIPPVRDVRAVFGVEVSLHTFSRILVGLNLNGGSAWVFSGRTAAMLAYSDLNVALFESGQVKRTFEMPVRFINQTMAFVLARNGISDPSNVSQYAQIQQETNVFAVIDSVEQIILVQKALNRDGLLWYLIVSVPRQRYFQYAEYATRVSLIIIFVCILPCTLILAFLVAKFLFSKPSVELAKGMDLIASEFKVDSSSEVQKFSPILEINTMQRSFQAMRNAILGFSKFAPVHIVKAMLSQSVTAELGVIETHASCYFSDIVGFTSISEAYEPRLLIMALAEYFNQITESIHQRNGVVGDFIGDAVFAFWNCPVRVEHHAFMACDAAIEHQKTILTRLRQDFLLRGLPQFRIRIGINSGPVLAGNVGASERMKYTLIGDTVNLAARLESLGKHYGVELIISKATFDSPGVKEGFVARALDIVTVVGKTEGTQIFQLLARRAEATTEELQLESASFKMMAAYLSRNFELALSHLDEMLAVIPGDYSASMMRDRVLQYMREGVPANWTGAHKMDSK